MIKRKRINRIAKFFEKIKLKRPNTIDRVVFAIIFVVFVFYSLSLLYPYVWAIIASLKGVNEYFENPFGLPAKPLFSNYVKALSGMSFNGYGFLSLTFNSIWWSSGTVFISTFCVSIFAYTMAKYNFVGKKILSGINMFLILVPIMGSMPAAYRLYNIYKIINTPLMLLTSIGGFGMTYLILQSFYMNLSWSYAEAAYVDGANDFTIYFKIMLPMSIPPIAATVLMGFIGHWNDYMTPLLYMTSFPTLASGLYSYRLLSVDRFGTYPTYLAGIVVSMLPILILYSLFHKTIMENMLGGGLKE